MIIIGDDSTNGAWVGSVLIDDVQAWQDNALQGYQGISTDEYRLDLSPAMQAEKKIITDAEVVELLAGSIAELTTRGWLAGIFMDRVTGAVCASGAMHCAAGLYNNTFETVALNDQERLHRAAVIYRAADVLSDLIGVWDYERENVPLENRLSGLDRVIEYNDSEAERGEDIILLFEQAIANLKENA